MLIKTLCDHGQVFLFSFAMPPVCVAVCDCADHPIWFLLCLLCCAVLYLLCCVTLPMLLTLVYSIHSVLCSSCAVFNHCCVFHACVLLCVRPEVVAGKGQEPVETQMGRMVRIGKGAPDQTKIQWLLHVRPGKDW